MQRSARRQMTVYFVLFTLSLATLFSGVTFFVFHRVEDRLIQRRLEQMLGGGAVATPSNPVHYAGPLAGAPQPFASRLHDAGVGSYEWEEDGRESHARLRVDPVNGEVTVALLSFSEQSNTEWRLALALIAGVGVASILALLVARYLAIRIVAPIERLTEALEMGPLEEAVPDELASPDRTDEIGTLARALRRAGSELVASADREGQFIREASHELRTPITVIQGVCDLLEESVDPEDAVTCGRVARLARGARRMDAAVQSLLTMARAEHRLSIGEALPFEEQLADLVAEAKSLADPCVVVRCEVREAPPSFLAASMLVVVLSNFVRNSVEHTREGSVVVRVGDGWAVVTDTGPGLSDGLIQQLNRGRDDQHQGAGLGIGLATVLRICGRLGWEFRAECPLEGGTRMSVGWSSTPNPLPG